MKKAKKCLSLLISAIMVASLGRLCGKSIQLNRNKG